MLPLYGSPVLMVEQPARLMPDGYYQVFDGQGHPVAHVREHMPSRHFLGGGRYRPHRFGVYAPDGEPVFTLDKPWKWGRPHIHVTDAHGGPIGSIVQDLKFTGSRFWLQDPNGRHIGCIEGDWNNWHFQVFDAQDQAVAEINKEYTGLFSGRWGTEDRYSVQFAFELPDPLHTLLVAASITIDVLLHDQRRSSDFYAYGRPDMWHGDAFHYDGGYWGPRGGWDTYYGYYGRRYYRGYRRPRRVAYRRYRGAYRPIRGYRPSRAYRPSRGYRPVRGGAGPVRRAEPPSRGAGPVRGARSSGNRSGPASGGTPRSGPSGSARSAGGPASRSRSAPSSGGSARGASSGGARSAGGPAARSRSAPSSGRSARGASGGAARGSSSSSGGSSGGRSSGGLFGGGSSSGGKSGGSRSSSSGGSSGKRSSGGLFGGGSSSGRKSGGSRSSSSRGRSGGGRGRSGGSRRR